MTKTAKRIYIVTNTGGGPVAKSRLVKAASAAAARNYVARSSINVSVASQDELVAMLGDGIVVEPRAEPAGEASA